VHIRCLAVGVRQPAWVEDAVGTYISRLPREWSFRCDTVAAAKRGRNDPADRARDSEGEAVLARFAAREFVVLLDERGRLMSSSQLAAQLADWQAGGRDLCFVIGGPDGVSAAVRDRADFAWSLSPLTLPHGLARVMLAEQLYRAWSLQSGHPYHRN
jgi:23S rRNA (pseudouridine1915-N3)-methyltransferase